MALILPAAPVTYPTVIALARRHRRPAVIVVADKPDLLRQIHNAILDRTSIYDIITVTSNAEALGQIVLHAVPLVIIDDQLAGPHGPALAHALTRAAPATCVALISAGTEPERKRRARATGARYVFAKPLVADQLAQLVVDALIAKPQAV